jgi:hypothetical protein
VKKCLSLAAIFFATITARPQASLTTHFDDLKSKGKLNGSERMMRLSAGTGHFINQRFIKE